MATNEQIDNYDHGLALARESGLTYEVMEVALYNLLQKFPEETLIALNEGLTEWDI